MAFKEWMQKRQACGDNADGWFNRAPRGEVVHGKCDVLVVAAELNGITAAHRPGDRSAVVLESALSALRVERRGIYLH